jgi:TolB protein
VDSLGANERQLTANAWSSQVPAWRPGGRELVFYANPEGREQLFVLDVATRAVRRLTRSSGNDTAPSVSPDGRSVAFVSDRDAPSRDGPGDLYVLDIASAAVSRLTRDLAVQGQPGWTRDGARITFNASATGVSEVHVIGRDGSGLVRLTRGTEGIR